MAVMPFVVDVDMYAGPEVIEFFVLIVVPSTMKGN